MAVERRDVLRTKKALVTACYELILNPSSKQITVNDILERANISRGTFYAHYKDIPDLIDSVEDYMLDQFDELFSLSQIYKSKEECSKEFQKIVHVIQAKQKEIAVVKKYVSDYRLECKIKARFQKKLYDRLLDLYGARRASFLGICISATVFDAITYWIKVDSKISCEALCDNIANFLFEGYQGVIKRY